MDLVEVLFGSTEFAGTDGAAEDDDGEDEAEEGEDATSESALHLTEEAGSEEALQHCCVRRQAVKRSLKSVIRGVWGDGMIVNKR